MDTSTKTEFIRSLNDYIEVKDINIKPICDHMSMLSMFLTDGEPKFDSWFADRLQCEYRCSREQAKEIYDHITNLVHCIKSERNWR